MGSSRALGSLIALFLVGCGSSDPSPDPTKPGNGTPPIDPNAAPCDIHSGYAGDSQCILAPDPSVGFQLHYGPSAYDAESVKPWLLMPGEETTDCVFVKTPNEGEAFMHDFHVRLRPGSHHLLAFGIGTAHADTSAPTTCNQGVDTRMLVGTQEASYDITADRSIAPENQGLAEKIGPNTQVAIQLHFVNIGTEPILREAWVNAVYSDPAKVTQLGDPLFWLGGLAMNIQRNETKVIKAKCDAPDDGSRIVLVTGHYHTHTVRFSSYLTRAGSTDTELLYESYDNAHPGTANFDSATDNPEPDPVAKSWGGRDGSLTLMKGDRISWECEIVNDNRGVLTFADGVYTAEMCNLFGLYTPTRGSAWKCVNF